MKRRAAGPSPRRPATQTGTVPLTTAAGVLWKGQAYFLGIGRDGSLEGRIGEYRARTSPGVVLPGRWTRISLTYSGEEVVLSADGIRRDASALDAPSDPKKAPQPPSMIPASPDPFLIGSGGSPVCGAFSGGIDEVRLFGLVEPPSWDLGGREKILGWKKIIRFDRRGRLDPLFHEEGVQVILFEEAEKAATASGLPVTEVAVDYSVTYEEFLRRRNLEPEEGREAAEEAKLLGKLGDTRRIVISVDPSGTLR